MIRKRKKLDKPAAVVLGIAGSGRKNGNSEILLDKVLEGAKSNGAKTEKLVLNRLNIKLCEAENHCMRKGACFINDDMTKIYKKLKTADAVVIASPVYFGSVSAQLKTLIDRCQAIWATYFILKKKRLYKGRRRGIFISTSGHNKRRFFQNSKEIVEILFMILGIDLYKELYVTNLEDPGEVLKRKKVLDKAFRSGVVLVNTNFTDKDKR
ncbi:flavodoxin family protein [Candidatus Omnitrophota bacterium]